MEIHNIYCIFVPYLETILIKLFRDYDKSFGNRQEKSHGIDA